MSTPLRLAAALLLGLLSAAPAAAQIAPQATVEVQQGDVVTLAFDLGFKPSCKFDVSFDIEDPAVTQPVKNVECSKSTSFKFRGLQVGESLVTLDFSQDEPDCNGSFQEAILVVVTPDTQALVKSFRKAAQVAGKQIGGKFKEERKMLALALKQLDAQVKSGELTAQQAAALAVFFTDFAERKLAAGIALCVCLVQLLGDDLMEAAGLELTPGELQIGSCTSAFDALVTRALDNQRKLTDFADAQLKKRLGKWFGKDRVNLVTQVPFAAGDLGGPRTTIDPDGATSVPTRFTRTLSFSSGDTRTILLAGVADLDAESVLVKAWGPDGWSAEETVPVEPLDGLSEVGAFAVEFAGETGGDDELPPGQYEFQVGAPDQSDEFGVFQRRLGLSF